MRALGLFVCGSLAMVVEAFASGFGLCLLWRWFIVPPFAVQTLGVAEATGIVIVAMLFGGGSANDPPDAGDTGQALALLADALFDRFLRLAIIVGLGFIVHRLV